VRPAADAAAASRADGAAAPAPTAPPRNCRELRACVFRCKTDTACAMRCLSQAPAAAQTKYRAVEACSRKACPGQELGCRCTSECLHPSECAELLDECTDAQEDAFCAEHCL
jgi:hypothetical protein